MNLRSDIEQLTLADVIQGDIKNGYSPNSTESETGYWVLGLGALTDAGLNPTEVKPVEFNEKVKSALLKPGDFLISRSNTPDKVGRSLRFKGEIKNCSYPDLMMKFRPNTQLIDPSFLEYQLQSSTVRAYLKSCAAGSSASMVKITKSTVASTPIQLPPRAEQTKIAKILSTWDQAIAITERLLANSQQQKQALMQQMLTGQKRFAGFTEDWKRCALGQLFSERNEINRPDLSLLSITTEQGVIDRGDSGKKDTSSEDKSKYRRICPGDIGYNTMRMWQGVSGLSDREGIVSPAYTILQPTELVDSKFASYLFKTPTLIHVFMRHSQGLVSDTWNLKYEHFSKIKVFVPCVAEQQKIAQVLATADAEIANLQAQLAKLKLEKKALMQQLLTGQRRVRLDDEAAA